MNEQKSLLTHLSEALDHYRAERRTVAAQQTPPEPRRRLHHLLPTPGNVIFTLVMIAVLLWAQSAGAVSFLAPRNSQLAASTGTIAYQGRLADSAGNPLTSTLNMNFRLYSAVTGGAPLWSEQWTGSNGVKVSDGLFNVMLGSLTPIPQGVITGNANLFLGITVGTDDEMSPRVQLGSVPFAVQALSVPDGSVTTAKLAADVKLSNTIVASGNATAQFCMPGSSYVDIPGLGVTVNLPQAASVLINFQYREQREGTNWYRIRILRDGVSVFTSDSHYQAPGVHNHRNITYMDSPVASGSHTYSVQVDPNGTVLCIFADAQLSVVAFLGQ